jgi:hypothetical protein
MKKLIIGIALATGLSTAAIAEEKAMLPTGVDLSFVTDTERNVTQKTTATEFGVVAGVKGFTLSFLPTYSWTDEEVSDIEFGAKYMYALNDQISLVPYGEIHVDNDFNKGDKVIGVKTAVKF